IILNAARFDYNLSDKTSVDAEFSQSTQLYESFLNQYEYRGKAGIGYQVLPKVNLGAESVVGYLNVQESPGQIYEQVRLRTRYELTGKLSVKTSAGVEFREFSNGQPLRVNPVFGLGLEFQPFDGTFMSLEGYRNIYGSAAAVSQDYTATGLSLSVRQRFLQKITASAEVGYENDSYFGTSPETGTNSTVNYFFIRSSLAYPLTRCLAVQIFYEFQNNDSNQTDNTFSNNRAGG
ncbi:MAG TPA: outer membrane beta-barrel protein, partial [Terrimicrobiaceae bacterium]